MNKKVTQSKVLENMYKNSQKSMTLFKQFVLFNLQYNSELIAI